MKKKNNNNIRKPKTNTNVILRPIQDFLGLWYEENLRREEGKANAEKAV